MKGAAGQVSGTAGPAGSPAFSAVATQRQLGELGPQVGGQQLKLMACCRCVGIFLQGDGRRRFFVGGQKGLCSSGSPPETGVGAGSVGVQGCVNASLETFYFDDLMGCICCILF